MHIRYDDDFVEAAVFLCASGRRPGVPALQIRRFHAERERCYAVADPDERNAAFFKVHLGWFREWGLEQLLTGLLTEYSLLPDALNVLAFRQARSRHEEGAEMYVSTGVHNAMVALRMDRLECDEPLLRFLRHEFMHLHDMVDAAFGYSPQLRLSGQNVSQQRLTRERYRLLWDITIDGRLTKAGYPTVGRYEAHRAIFDKAFGFWPESRRVEIFASLWNDDSPRHGALLAIAADPREVKSSHQPLPGAPCPLCGFATFDWPALNELDEPVIATIRMEFPEWTPEQGACGRCIEVYKVLNTASLTTV